MSSSRANQAEIYMKTEQLHSLRSEGGQMNSYLFSAGTVVWQCSHGHNTKCSVAKRRGFVCQRVGCGGDK